MPVVLHAGQEDPVKMTSPYAKWLKGSPLQAWLGFGAMVLALLFTNTNLNGPINPSPKPSPPTTSHGVPKPSTAVFAVDGVWNATATTDVKTNAYIAAILSAFIYAVRICVREIKATE